MTDTIPSRQFLVQQAVLNRIASSYTTAFPMFGAAHCARDMEMDILRNNCWANYHINGIRHQFGRLASRFGSGT